MTSSLRRLLLSTTIVLGVLAQSPVGASAAPGVTSTLRWAEPVGAAPGYIFPFMTQASYSVANVNSFQQLMYRPLYWFGIKGSPELNAALSLARPPSYSNGDRSVTIQLKGWQWSNGEPVSARDLLFWLNMLHADKQWWAAYSPGAIPDLISTVATPSADELVLTLSQAVNPAWFTASQLSQITPLPVAWDISSLGQAPGAGGCSAAAYGSADASCNQVFSLLSRQAGFDPADPSLPNLARASYASNPLWQVVDGPWRLSALSPDGQVSFVPNPSYSGPTHPSYAQFVELPFSSGSQELSALLSNKLDVGYLPPQDLRRSTTTPLAPAQPEPRLAAFTLRPLYPWAVSYLSYNFASTAGSGVTAKILGELYVRQALQSLVAQQAFIKGVYRGYAVPGYGPIPSTPRSRTTGALGSSNPYPYDPGRARALLSSNGWSVQPGGVTTCAEAGSAAGQCGAGIPKGTALAFSIEYASDVPLLGALMNAEKASWAQAGISVQLTSAPSATVAATAVPCASGQSCSWQLASSGLGWLYEPGIYPSGEQLFLTGAASNLGSYSNGAMDGLIRSSLGAAGSLSPYARLAAADLPVLFEPTPAASLTEIRSSLRGVSPQDPLLGLTPENWQIRP